MDTLTTQLNALKQQQAGHYDPAGLRFIESLLERASTQRAAVRERLEAKAQHAIDTYQKKRHHAQQQAAVLVDSICPKAANTSAESTLVQQYYQQGYYQKVSQLAHRQPTNSHTNTAAQLRALTALLSTEETTQKTASDSVALNDLLQQQEQELLHGDDAQPSHHQYGGAPSMTLKAGRLYQQRKIKQRADDFINTALSRTPENPGPLNPEMLAIRLLKSMRDLSPEYLSRCSSYFETLLWLEQSTSKSSSGKPRTK